MHTVRSSQKSRAARYKPVWASQCCARGREAVIAGWAGTGGSKMLSGCAYGESRTRVEMTSDKRAGHLEAEPRPGLATSGMSWERWEHGKSRVGPGPAVPAGQVASVPWDMGSREMRLAQLVGGKPPECAEWEIVQHSGPLSPWPPLGKDTPLTGCPEAPLHPISLQKSPCSPPPPPHPVPRR